MPESEIGLDVGRQCLRPGDDDAFISTKRFRSKAMHLVALLLLLVEVWRDGHHDAASQFLLHLEDVFQHPVVLLGPQMIAGERVDQLGGDANAAGRLADAALQQVAHAEFAAHPADVG